jgi:hypothetical protein
MKKRGELIFSITKKDFEVQTFRAELKAKHDAFEIEWEQDFDDYLRNNDFHMIPCKHNKNGKRNWDLVRQGYLYGTILIRKCKTCGWMWRHDDSDETRSCLGD